MERHTKERLTFGAAGVIMASVALTGCGGEEAPKAEATTATAPAPVETTPPAPCDEKTKEMLLQTDPNCEPATDEELTFAVTAEKNGWTYDDPNAVLAAQKSLNINTVDNPLTSAADYHDDVGVAEKTFGVRDIEYTKQIKTLKQASEAYNLLLSNLNPLVNDLVQYKTDVAPEKLAGPVNRAISGDSKGTAFDWQVTEYQGGSVVDNYSAQLFIEQVASLVESVGPNQTIEFVKAATTPTDKTENSTYFEDMNDVESSGDADQSLELTGTVKVKITSFNTGANGIETTDEYVDFLSPDQIFVLFWGNKLGGLGIDPYATIRFGVHDAPDTATD